MKLITWNCQGAFRKKAPLLLKYKPDILVIQECEHPDKLIYSKGTKTPNDILWFGDNQHKGVGIFSYSDYRFKALDIYDPSFKIIAPVAVTCGSFDFTLFAVWANNPSDKKNQYIGQVWKAVKYYDSILNKGLSILTGDFNSNKIWDRVSRVENHSAVVNMLADKNIYSIYHKQLIQEQGKENHPTFYLHRDKNKPYHLDYCFASDNIISKVESIKVGSYKKWIAHSDHSPIIMEFNLD